MENRTRPIQIKFFVDEQELDVIHQRMALMGIKNMSAYLRKISQDGFLYNVEYPGLHEVCSQIESISVNINQIAKRVNETDHLHSGDLERLQEMMEAIWLSQKCILSDEP